MFDKLLQFVDS
jgi:tetratricopeptide (TPR) repeat protein